MTLFDLNKEMSLFGQVGPFYAQNPCPVWAPSFPMSLVKYKQGKIKTRNVCLAAFKPESCQLLQAESGNTFKRDMRNNIWLENFGEYGMIIKDNLELSVIAGMFQYCLSEVDCYE